MKTRIRVSVTIPAPPERVWDDVGDLASHVEWMADAESITFRSARRDGVGTTFDCVTRVGPIRLTDRMEVVEWAPRLAMGVRHEGLVTGVGRFTLERRFRRRTRFTWEERLDVPWWLGGPLATPVLYLIWRRNLRRLRARF
ncbi:MAG: SRPBCC family protein [Acidimicrobiia bacterium]